MNDETLKLRELIQCSRRSCGYVLWRDEMLDIPHPTIPRCTKQICPECASDSFYTLNTQGRVRTTKDNREGTPREINPADIEPSPRMGPKMKSALLNAKRRALELPTTN